jgi:elongation factor G
VEPQSETVWKQADKHQVPRIAFINKMDRVGSDFETCIQMMVDRLHTTPLPLQIPIGKEEDFQGVIDLVTMKAIRYDAHSLGERFDILEIPESYQEKARKQREVLIERVSEWNDSLMEKFIEGRRFRKRN